MPAATPDCPRPHPDIVDTTPYEGHTVLGESLAVLTSALLRCQSGLGSGLDAAQHGMVEFSATWSDDEVEAFRRAMSRVEPGTPHDALTEEQRDCDRFLAVVEQISEAWETTPLD